MNKKVAEALAKVIVEEFAASHAQATAIQQYETYCVRVCDGNGKELFIIIEAR